MSVVPNQVMALTKFSRKLYKKLMKIRSKLPLIILEDRAYNWEGLTTENLLYLAEKRKVVPAEYFYHFNNNIYNIYRIKISNSIIKILPAVFPKKTAFFVYEVWGFFYT